MKFVAYPSYKPSGVEWIGDVPEQWNVLPLRRRLIAIKDGTHGSFERAADGVPLLSAKNVTDGKIVIGENESMISLEDWTEITRNGFPRKGDVLLTIVGTVGRSAVFDLDEPVAFQRSVAFLRFREDQNPQFLRYAFDSAVFQAQLQSYINAAAQGGTYMGDVVGIPLVFPSAPEQHAIADFLDVETEKLETLIAKKRDLIQKLKEKRSALISRTVTRGLPPESARVAEVNPNPKLKPSGIEWLGDIPEQWSTPPLYTRYIIELGKMLDESRITGNHLIPYLRNIDVQWDLINTFDLPEMDIRQDEYARYTLSEGDLLVCEGGDVGRAAIFQKSDSVLGFQKALHRLRAIDSNECPRFLYYTLYWAANHGVFLAEGNPNTIPHLTGEKLRRYRFPKPPLPEQRLIADYLDCETAKIDRMVAKVQEAIERLQEYRTALVTAAVTGKIDVREAMG